MSTEFVDYTIAADGCGMRQKLTHTSDLDSLAFRVIHGVSPLRLKRYTRIEQTSVRVANTNISFVLPYFHERMEPATDIVAVRSMRRTTAFVLGYLRRLPAKQVGQTTAACLLTFGLESGPDLNELVAIGVQNQLLERAEVLLVHLDGSVEIGH